MTKSALEYLCQILQRLDTEQDRSGSLVRSLVQSDPAEMNLHDWLGLGRQVEGQLTVLMGGTKLDGIRWLEDLRVHIHRDIGAVMRGQFAAIASSSS